ncbi:hypothetical protein [Streptomyces hokutonensis]|uniref:hypothetical protein n=1 Tax=Streptomyces hokutonensis TaxID=1306990 RepID=UPI0003741B6F|nr:hypothetical protein [Streptomyces hokutonensis]
MNRSLRPPRTGKNRRTAAAAWLARRRRTALTQVLRGACYGMGTGAIGLVFMLMEYRLR